MKFMGFKKSIIIWFGSYLCSYNFAFFLEEVFFRCIYRVLFLKVLYFHQNYFVLYKQFVTVIKKNLITKRDMSFSSTKNPKR